MGRNKSFEDVLKSCQECRKVWQNSTPFTDPYNNKGGASYYHDFPHYGLIKAKCPKCKEMTYELNA